MPTPTAPSQTYQASSLGDALNAALGTSEMPASVATPISQLPSTPAVAPAQPAETPKVAEPVQTEAPKVEAPKVEATESEEPKAPEIKTPSKLIDSLLTPDAEKPKELPKVLDENLAEDEKLPGKATASANSAFAAKARALKTAEQELAKLKAELEAARQSGSKEASAEVQSIKAELEENRKLVEDYENQLSLVRLESTREFKRTIAEPMSRAEKAIAEALTGYEGINVKDVVRVLDIADPAQRKAEFKDLMSGVDQLDALAVRNKLDEIAQLRNQKDELLKSANDTLSKMEQQETLAEQQARLQFDKEADVAFELTWNQFEDSFPILKRGQSTEWDQTVKALREQAVYLDKQPLDHTQRATLTYQAVLFPLAVQVVRDLTTKSNATIAELKAQLSKYQAATPSAGAGANNPPASALPANAGFLDVLEKAMGR